MDIKHLTWIRDQNIINYWIWSASKHQATAKQHVKNTQNTLATHIAMG